MMFIGMQPERREQLLSGHCAGLFKGSSSGGGEQADATKYAAELQNEQFNRIQNQLAPYEAAGIPALNQLQNLSTLSGQNTALNDYYNSDQYKQLNAQAKYGILSAGEATGGLGNTSTSNSLAAIAPQLGQNYLSSQMQNYSNLLSVGQNAAAGTASAGQTYANNAGALAQQGAAYTAAQNNQPSGLSSALTGAASGAATGAMIGSAFPGIGTAVGAVGGGVVGALGSLL